MGIYLSDNDHDRLTNLRFADDVRLLASSKEQLRKMLYEFKKGTEKVGLRIHPEKDENSQQPEHHQLGHKKELEIEDMKIEILTRSESVKYLGQKISATFRKYRQELTSKNYMLNHRLRVFDAAISPTFCHAAGTWTPNKEHERMIQSTQRKMLRLIIQTRRIYKKVEKQESKTNEEIEETDTNDLRSTDDESGDGLSTKTHNDVDSEVSFEDDADEVIDTTLIEEEDWIEYIKRSTDEAKEKMESAKKRKSCWNKTRKKMKWKLPLRNATSPSADWNPEPEHKIQDQQSDWETKKKMGR